MKKILVIVLSITILCIIGFIVIKNQPAKKEYLSTKYYENKTNSFQEIDEEKIKELKEDTYLLYTFNSYCKFPIPCDSIFEQFMEENQSYLFRMISIKKRSM